MDDPRERDQFARITLYQDIEKARQMLARYEEGMSHYRHVIEACMRRIGRLDGAVG